MQSFTYHVPTKVIFGKGAEEKVAPEIKAFGGSRVYIVYGGGSVLRSGLLDRVESSLTAQGLPFETLGGVQPNPRLSLARSGVEHARDFGADFVLAIGGGSVIDTAKAIAHGVANPETDIWDFWDGKAKVTRSLPVGVVLTISAAGSETSDSAVLTNEETGIKKGLSTEFNRPRFAAMDPELTFTLPPYQIGCGIVDIMMHTMDRYFTPTQGNETTDALAEALLKTVIENGRKAILDPHDYAAMSELMWCGSLSHNGLTGLGAVVDFAPHKLGHELSGRFDVAHGASLSTIWASWARYTWQAHPERFLRFAKNVWNVSLGDETQTILRGIATCEAYFRSLGMPTNFTSLGIGKQSEDVLRDMAAKATRNDTVRVGAFYPLTQEDMVQIYRLANR